MRLMILIVIITTFVQSSSSSSSSSSSPSLPNVLLDICVSEYFSPECVQPHINLATIPHRDNIKLKTNKDNEQMKSSFNNNLHINAARREMKRFTNSNGIKGFREEMVVVMEKALFGRMQEGRCISKSSECRADVLSYLDLQCSGKPACQVYVADATMHKLGNCSKDLTSYLQVQYSCLKVLKAVNCTTVPNYVQIGDDEQKGVFVTATNVVCNRMRVVAYKGQRIKVTLVNFDRFNSTLYAKPKVCMTVATIIDEAPSQKHSNAVNITICAHTPRQSAVYHSSSSSISLFFRHSSNFVLHFEATGCREPEAPWKGSVKVIGYKAIFSCNSSNQEWTLKCLGGVWHGSKFNCSNGVLPQQFEGGRGFLNREAFPYGILLVVAIGVALGVLAGGLMLSLVAFYMRRFYANRPNENLNKDIDQTPKTLDLPFKEGFGSNDESDYQQQIYKQQLRFHTCQPPLPPQQQQQQLLLLHHYKHSEDPTPTTLSTNPCLLGDHHFLQPITSLQNRHVTWDRGDQPIE